MHGVSPTRDMHLSLSFQSLHWGSITEAWLIAHTVDLQLHFDWATQNPQLKSWCYHLSWPKVPTQNHLVKTIQCDPRFQACHSKGLKFAFKKTKARILLGQGKLFTKQIEYSMSTYLFLIQTPKFHSHLPHQSKVPSQLLWKILFSWYLLLGLWHRLISKLNTGMFNIF